MAEKQSHLNGAYYGPAVPPPTQTYHRHGRGRGCGCCCLFSFLLKLVVSLVIIIGLAVLIFWLIFRPTNVKFYVTDASLTEFSLTGNNTLQYNLAVNITVRNPNRKIGIYYDTIEARALYGDQRLDMKTLTPFYQGHKNTSYLSTVFSGQKVVIGSDELTQFNEEKTAGVYSVDVDLYLRIRFKVGKLKTRRMKPEVKCDLKVPLSSTGNSAVAFESTKCDIDFW